MACGAPTIVSNCSAMPEVAGGAALLIDPLDPAEISVAIKSVLTNPIQSRALSEAGLLWTRASKWETVAQNTGDFLAAAV